MGLQSGEVLTTLLLIWFNCKLYRAFLDMQKVAPNLAVIGWMGPASMSRKLGPLRYWNRCVKLEECKLTKGVFI